MRVCPECNTELYYDDSRCDTDRGVMGDEVYYCEECGYQENMDGCALDIPKQNEVKLE